MVLNTYLFITIIYLLIYIICIKMPLKQQYPLYVVYEIRVLRILLLDRESKTNI